MPSPRLMPSPGMATTEATAAMAAATTARGPLMPSPRLTLLPSPATATTEATAAMAAATTATARGPLMLSPATATTEATAAMVATAMAATVTAAATATTDKS